MIQLPLPILLQVWASGTRGRQRKARFAHETIAITLPAGASISTEIGPATPGINHYIFAMTFGDLIDPNIVITHEHAFMMKRHDDPLVYSIVRQPYPLNLKVNWELPHKVAIENRGSVDRDVEVTFWLVEMDDETDRETQAAFLGYLNLLTSFSQVTPNEIANFIKGKASIFPPSH